MQYSVDPADHARIFGPKDDFDSAGPGRSRKCKSCGGWHRLDRPWPHNCRKEGPRRNLDLAVPQLAPAFEAFQTGGVDEPEIIGSRKDKREYMERNDLVEYDAGVGNQSAQWVRDREEAKEVGETVKRFIETDQEYWTPEERGEVASTKELATDGQDVDLSQAVEATE